MDQGHNLVFAIAYGSVHLKEIVIKTELLSNLYENQKNYITFVADGRKEVNLFTEHFHPANVYHLSSKRIDHIDNSLLIIVGLITFLILETSVLKIKQFNVTK